MDERQTIPEQQTPVDTITWTASEFAMTQKSIMWNAGLLGVLVAVGALLIIFRRDYASAVAIVMAGILYLVISAKKPRALRYSLDDYGFKIADKYYSFDMFKSFMLINAGGVVGLEFLPVKRFAPEVSFFLPPEDTERIIKFITQHVPHDQTRVSRVDQLAKKLKI